MSKQKNIRLDNEGNLLMNCAPQGEEHKKAVVMIPSAKINAFVGMVISAIVAGTTLEDDCMAYPADRFESDFDAMVQA